MTITKTVEVPNPKFKVGDYAVTDSDLDIGENIYFKVFSVHFRPKTKEWEYNLTAADFDYNGNTYKFAVIHEEDMRKPTTEELSTYFR